MEITIDQNWEKYRKACVPENAGEEQLRETRNAFFAGSNSIFYVFLAMRDAPEELRAAVLRHIELEVHSFLMEQITLSNAMAR